MTRTWQIGSGGDCDLVVARPGVAARHCRLRCEPPGAVVEDLGSPGGTYVNGVRVSTPTRVTPGDAVLLGGTVPMPWPDEAVPLGWRILRIGREPDNQVVVNLPIVSGYHARLIWDAATGKAIIEDLGSSNGTAVGAPDRRVARAVLTGSETLYLGTHPLRALELLSRLGTPASVSQALVFRGPEMTIGRDPGADLTIDNSVVSGRHARLSRREGQVFLEDLGSSNGTFVNGQRIDRPVAVKEGDAIALGNHVLKLAIEQAPGTTVQPVATTAAVSDRTRVTAAAQPVPGATEISPTLTPLDAGSWWTEVAQAYAALAQPVWRAGALTGLGPLAAVLIALLLASSSHAERTREAGAAAASVVPAALFWLGFTAVAAGLAVSLLGRDPQPDPQADALGRGEPQRVRSLVARLVALGSCCVLQCAVALAIVYAGVGLRGAPLPMLGLLILASLVGLLIGQAIVVLVPRPEFAVPLAALVLAALWLFGGHWRTLPDFNPLARIIASALPTRWAFEDLLLLEAEAEQGDPAELARTESESDLAEPYFPAETERMGVRAGSIALTAMVIGLTASTLFLSGMRPEPGG